MNEKLREIANRHLIIRYDEDSQLEEFSNDALIVLDELLKDVIKECILACNTNMTHGTLMSESRIKEHFGIE